MSNRDTTPTTTASRTTPPNPPEAFADPVSFLAAFGIEAELLDECVALAKAA